MMGRYGGVRGRAHRRCQLGGAADILREGALEAEELLDLVKEAAARNTLGGGGRRASCCRRRKQTRC